MALTTGEDYVFQSTPPMREATFITKPFIPNKVVFQSTPPMREATVTFPLLPKLIKFQSTPPMREATALKQMDIDWQKISIHASHAGGDS